MCPGAGAVTGGVSLATASSIAGGETIKVELTGGPEAALLDFDGDDRFDMGDRVEFSLC